VNRGSESEAEHRGAPTEATSSTLIELVKQRERDAWNRLAELYGPMVYAWCRRIGLNAEDARDVVQDVFAAVATGIGQFRGGRRGAFRAWLRTITRNKVHDHFRREEHHTSAEGGSSARRRLMELADGTRPADESATGPSDPGEDDVWRYLIALVRAQFSDHVWTAFWRTTVDAQPPAEVAEELDMSVAAVYQAKSRVLRRLRQALGELEEAD
jgi:RNA polymerase sigma-70 factor (ECF subfamily)